MRLSRKVFSFTGQVTINMMRPAGVNHTVFQETLRLNHRTSSSFDFSPNNGAAQNVLAL